LSSSPAAAAAAAAATPLYAALHAAVAPALAKWAITTRSESKSSSCVVDNSCVGCDAEFSSLLRRYHCRFCGLVFCGLCSARQIMTARACDACFDKSLDCSSGSSSLRTPLSIQLEKLSMASRSSGSTILRKNNSLVRMRKSVSSILLSSMYETAMGECCSASACRNLSSHHHHHHVRQKRRKLSEYAEYAAAAASDETPAERPRFEFAFTSCSSNNNSTTDIRGARSSLLASQAAKLITT